MQHQFYQNVAQKVAPKVTKEKSLKIGQNCSQILGYFLTKKIESVIKKYPKCQNFTLSGHTAFTISVTPWAAKNAFNHTLKILLCSKLAKEELSHRPTWTKNLWERKWTLALSANLSPSLLFSHTHTHSCTHTHTHANSITTFFPHLHSPPVWRTSYKNDLMSNEMSKLRVRKKLRTFHGVH